MIRQLAIICIAILLFACGTSEKEQRQRIPDGTYRPSGFHAFISHGEGNIPVSLVKADSLYHLFYTTGVDEWGHLSSRDLLSWKPELSFPIADHGFGAVIWDENNLSGLNAKWAKIWSNGNELYLSYSQDGANWTDFEDNPILEAEGQPAVNWSADLEQWVMTTTKQGQISIYTSRDLVKWNSSSSASLSTDIEMASLFSIDGQWILMAQGENLIYQLGTFDGTTFNSTTSPIKFNGMKANLGVIMQSETENIIINKNPTTNDQLPTFTSPFSLNILDDRLQISPSETFQSLVVGKRRSKLGKLITDGPSWYQLTIEPEFEEIEIVVSDKTSDLRIKWDVSTQKISFSGISLPLEQEKEHLIETEISTSDLKIDILIDHACVDLFINNGVYATSILTLPDTFFSQVEIFLDGEKYDARTILLDIGI